MTGRSNVPNVVHVGPHWLEIEPPDVLHIHYEGDVDVEHFKVFDTNVLNFPPQTRVYVLRDARRGGTMTAATRMYMAKNVDVRRVAAMVTYGSSFQTKAVTTMVNKALRHLHSGTGASVFFETEAEARAWIAADRSARSSENDPSSGAV